MLAVPVAVMMHDATVTAKNGRILVLEVALANQRWTGLEVHLPAPQGTTGSPR